MNRRRIIKELDTVFNKFVDSIDDEIVKSLVRKNGYITGGAIVSLLKDEKPNDYDIYFVNKVTVKAVLDYYLKKFKENCYTDPFNSDSIAEVQEMANGRVRLYIPHKGTLQANKEVKDYMPYFLSTNAISLSNDIQLVHRFYGDPAEVHDSYDFVHCTCYYHPREHKLELPQKALESIITNELIYTGSKYPLASIIRTRKFLKRGWNINAGQYVKMGLQLGNFDLTDPLVLEEQLTGVDLVLFGAVISAIKEKKENEPSFKPTIEYISNVIDSVFNEEGLL